MTVTMAAPRTRVDPGGMPTPPDPEAGPRQSRGLHQMPEHACGWNLAPSLGQRGRVAPGHDLGSSDKWGANRDVAGALARLWPGSSVRVRSSGASLVVAAASRNAGRCALEAWEARRLPRLRGSAKRRHPSTLKQVREPSTDPAPGAAP